MQPSRARSNTSQAEAFKPVRYSIGCTAQLYLFTEGRDHNCPLPNPSHPSFSKKITRMTPSLMLHIVTRADGPGSSGIIKSVAAHAGAALQGAFASAPSYPVDNRDNPEDEVPQVFACPLTLEVN